MQNEVAPVSEDGKNKKTIYLIVFIIIALIILGLIIYYYWTGIVKPAPSPTPSISKSSSTSPSKTPNNYDGWKTYSNSSYNYSIKYPADAKLDSATPGCVTINTQYGHVIIRGKNYEEICGRTGVGSEYTELHETIIVGGKNYNSTGFMSNSTNPYDEFLMFTHDSGNGIDYGMDNFNKNSSNPTYETVKNEVKQIVESFSNS